MKDWSKRLKISLAGASVGLLAAGGAAAVVIPASAQAASRAPAVHANASILSVCLTIREIHFGPQCLVI